MKYTSITSPEPVVQYLTSTLAKRLDGGKKTVWLLPGGSAIQIAADVSKNLVELGLDLSNLMVTLTDERYVRLDGPDENWPQLEAAGLTLPGATTYRVIQGDMSREDTTEKFGAKLKEFFDVADYRLGFFGIGPDGHTAGIKPHSFDMNTSEYAASFEGEDFERITMTPNAVSKLDEVVAYAVGEAKAETLNRLVNETVSLADQPAQCLKSAGKFTLFTDVNIKEEKS